MQARDREPGRTCLGCRQQRPRAELVRIVRGPDGAACFDVDARLPGRGAWVCPAPGCLDALSPGAVGHVLRAPVRLAGAAERRRDLEGMLARRIANLLSIARRMRAVTLGPTGVRAKLAEGRARLVLISGELPADAAAAWVARCGAIAVRVVPGQGTLGALAGAGPVDAAAVTVDGLAGEILTATDRWRAFCDDSCDNERSKITGQRRAVPRREEAEKR